MSKKRFNGGALEPQSLLEERLCYRFSDPNLLQTALTHSSYVNENKGGENNERLEFFGDAVLQMIVSRYLYTTYPTASEGELSDYRKYVVCNRSLARPATRIGLGRFLRLGRGEEMNGGRKRPAMLAKAMEAVSAAIYLDVGEDKDRAAEVLLRLLADELNACRFLCGGDYKTRLLQLVEQDGQERLEYHVRSCEGPAHAPLFTVEACLNSNVIGVGQGHTKQEAEYKAACEALYLFGLNDQ